MNNNLRHFRLASIPLLLLLWTLLLWGGMHAIRGYWEPDEARFVYVAREMAATGDWIIPHRHGVTYGEKPPLMFWLINLGETLLPLPFGSRLPSFIGVFLSLLSMYGIANFWGNKVFALRTLAVLSSSLLFWQVGGMGQIDALLLGLESSALYLLLRNDRHHPDRLPWAAFLLMGFAVLAKGPVGLLIPLGVYLCLRIATRHNPGPRTRSTLLIPGILIALAVPLAWLATCYFGDAPDGYLHKILYTQNISRAAGGRGHLQSPFYYLLHLPLGFLPWALFAPSAIIGLRKSNPALLRKLAVWALYVVVFFSIPVSKRNLYILFAMPALAMMIAAAWDDLNASAVCRKMATAIFAALAVVSIGAALAIILHNDIPSLATNERVVFSLGTLHIWPWALLASIAVAATWMLHRPDPQWLKRFTAAACATFAICGWTVFPDFDEIKIPRAIAPLAAQYIPEDGRLILYHINGETLALHAGRTGLRCEEDEDTLLAMAEQGRGLAIFMEKDAASLESRFPGIVETGAFRMGSKRFIWAAYVVNAGEQNPSPPPSAP